MPAIVALLDDLMFLSRIREAARGLGVEVRAVRGADDLVEACRDEPRAVIVDLDNRRLPVEQALAALRADPGRARIPVVGFFSHVNAERGRDALAAGCSRVLPRSAFVRELPSLLQASVAREAESSR
jgi:CheY-like chemotaxis protein